MLEPVHTVNSTSFPPGNACGQTWSVSAESWLTVVNGCETPPTAGTRCRPPLVPNTIVSLEAQVTPMSPPLSRVMLTASPPRTGTRFNVAFASSKNAIDAPSGEKTG